MNNFDEINLPDVLRNALNKNNFTIPTEIQAKTIPLTLEGKDIIGSAQTGTGKTLAFIIPTIVNLLKNPDHKAIIIEPTRELAQQVLDVTISLCKQGLNMFSTLLIGGESYSRQINNLKRDPRIIIGTPGRIIDHLERKTLNLENCHTLVLDETDRMFDMGFYIQLENIISHIPQERQTLMFSATFPKEIEELATKQLKNPEKIFVQPKEDPNSLSPDLKQETLILKEDEKYNELINQINKREGAIIIFVKTKRGAEILDKKLYKDRIPCFAIHGDLPQRRREYIIDKFRKKKCRVLIGTDVIARGLDVPHVMHIINYDVPYAPEDYIHRVGRTARNGSNGFAITFLTPDDDRRWEAIQCLLDPSRKKQRHFEQRRRSSFDRFGFRKRGDRSNYRRNNKFGKRDSNFGFKREGNKFRGEDNKFDGGDNKFGDRKSFFSRERNNKNNSRPSKKFDKTY